MSSHATTKLDDSIFYIYNEGLGKHQFYRCLETLPDGQVKAVKINAGPVRSIEGSPKIQKRDWNLVGIYEYFFDDVPEQSIVVPTSSITGKGLSVDGFMITLPDPVLQET